MAKRYSANDPRRTASGLLISRYSNGSSYNYNTSSGVLDISIDALPADLAAASSGPASETGYSAAASSGPASETGYSAAASASNASASEVTDLLFKPMKLSKVTEINLQADKNIKEIEYSICTKKKDLRSIAKKMEEGIIYNESDKKIYSVNDKKTTVFAINKSGQHLTHKHFGDNMTLFANDENNTVDNLPTASKGQAQSIKVFEKRIFALETKIESLKTGAKGEKGDTGIQGLPGERGPKGDSGSSSIDTDIITGINSKISSLEKAIELDQKLPSSSSNNNNINYYLNRNYEDIKSNSWQFDSVFSRLAASELLIEDLTSVIGTLTGKIEALELGL